MSDYCAYPAIDSPDSKKREYLDKYFNANNRFRLFHMYRMAVNTFFYQGAQDIRAPRQLTVSGSGFKFEKESFRVPLRPDNIIATNVNNEISRHLGKKYRPDPQAETNDPELMAAAKLGRQLLEHKFKAEKWGSIQYELAFDFTTAGTMISKTYLEENNLELTPLASETAVKCTGPECGALYSEPTTDTGEPMEACVACQTGTLEPYEMSVEEVGTTDTLGRQMGSYAPSTKVCWEAVNWSQFYPENHGFGVEPHNMKVWGQKSPRSLDYIAAYFPEFQNLKAEDPQELMRGDPILGYNMVTQGGSGSAFYDGVFDNHANLEECHIEPMPYPGLEMGHSLYRVGDEIVSRPLCVEVDVPANVSGQPQEPRKVRKVQYHAARRCREPKRFWGRTPVDDQVPLQRSINRLDAMVEDIRERGGPMAGFPMGVEIHDRGFEGALRVFEFEAENPGWTLKDSIVNAQPLTGNAYMEERQAKVNALQRLGAPDVELGKNPTGVNTIGQLQILAEQAEQQRGPSLDEYKALLEASWGHILELYWAFQREETTVEVEGVPGSYEQKAWVGSDLLGQTRVSVTAKGSVDKQVLKQEVTKAAFEMGLYGDAFQFQPAREEMLEILGAPKVDQAKSMQVERANQAWTEFKQDGSVPVFDESNHDPSVWYRVLLNSWLSDDGLAQQREADWNQVLRGIAGWREQYEQQLIQEQMLQAAFQAAQQANVGMQQQGLAPLPLPEIPQPGPKSIDQRLLVLWAQMLGDRFPNKDTMLKIADQPELLRSAALRDRLLRLYAVMMQCKILYEKAAMAAMAPPAAPPAQQGAANA